MNPLSYWRRLNQRKFIQKMDGEPFFALPAHDRQKVRDLVREGKLVVSDEGIVYKQKRAA